MKADINFLTKELEDLQLEYQKLQEKNESILQENDKIKKMVYEADLNMSEVEKLNDLNDELLLEIERLRDQVTLKRFLK